MKYDFSEHGMDNNAIKNIANKAFFLCVALFFSMLFGCASNPRAHPDDPWEGWNRGVTEFNDGIDAAIAKPIAMVYKNVLPHMVQTGVHNFFSNLTDPWTAINSVLQLKPKAAAESTMRFMVNTVFGLGGLLDVADEMNIEKHKEDFGQTLGYWGIGPGPYLVLPLLGPTTLRDAVAATAIAKGDLVWQARKIPIRNSLYALRLVDKRANLLRSTAVLDMVALDKYSFTRDIFLQMRRSEVFDGNAPEELVKDTETADGKSDSTKKSVEVQIDAQQDVQQNAIQTDATSKNTSTAPSEITVDPTNADKEDTKSK